MFGLGLVLALAAMGRTVVGLVFVVGSMAGFASESSSLAAVLMFAMIAASATYLVWFAFTGHRQLRSPPVPSKPRNIVLAYGVLTVLELIGYAIWA